MFLQMLFVNYLSFAQASMGEDSQGPLLLTWFNFNPGMDK